MSLKKRSHGLRLSKKLAVTTPYLYGPAALGSPKLDPYATSCLKTLKFSVRHPLKARLLPIPEFFSSTSYLGCAYSSEFGTTAIAITWRSNGKFATFQFLKISQRYLCNDHNWSPNFSFH